MLRRSSIVQALSNYVEVEEEDDIEVGCPLPGMLHDIADGLQTRTILCAQLCFAGLFLAMLILSASAELGLLTVTSMSASGEHHHRRGSGHHLQRGCACEACEADCTPWAG
jgi:hypothetical protein